MSRSKVPHMATRQDTNTSRSTVVVRRNQAETKGTARGLRRHNRALLLSGLYFGQPRSRLELGRATGLSQATVSNVIGDLIEAGLVVEAGLVNSDGGRPRTLLRVNAAYTHIIGVDVGETRVRAAIVDLAMRPLAAVDHPLASPRPEPDAVVEQVLSCVRHVSAEAGVAEGDILGVGVGVPGTVEQGHHAKVHAQVIGWDAVPLEQMLQAGTKLPIWVENGAKTLGQAEMWFGGGRGARNAVVTLIGSGVGAAVITDGRIYRGATSSAGEWGHTTLLFDGRRCRCGARGCLEAYVGAEATLDRWRHARGGRAVPGSDEESSLAALLAAAPTNQTAARVVQDTVDYLGAGIAGLVNLFNPERIVVAGWAGLAMADYLPQIREAVGERALRHPFSETTITLGELGPDAVALGAATLPVADLLAYGGTDSEAAEIMGSELPALV
jgi:predicted NBD/HSP70 family sugar kinase